MKDRRVCDDSEVLKNLNPNIDIFTILYTGPAIKKCIAALPEEE